MNSNSSKYTLYESVEYRECYVAFLDMLGFSNKCVKKELSCSEIFKLLSINSLINYVAKHKLLKHIIPKDVVDSTYYSIMSDSIFIAAPANDYGLLYILYLCSFIQNMLLENNVLLRGGITKGEFFGKDDIVFGPAVVEAYNIERFISNFPRIVLAECIIDDMKKAGLFKKKTPEYYISNAINKSEEDSIFSQIELLINQSTDDSLCFVNYLHTMQLIKLNHNPSIKQKIEDYIDKGVQSNNAKIKVKYLWTKNYYENSIKKYETIFSSIEKIRETE